MTDGKSGNIVNFKQARKLAGYAKKAELAAENRKKFGRTKAEKKLDAFEKHQEEKRHENRKLDE